MNKLKLVGAILFIIFLSKCANQLPPPGGEVDRIPPEIVNVYPPNNTVNFNDDHIELEFSEYVDKRSVQEAVFVSPYIEGGMKYEWSGKSVDIIFKDSLKKNTTYTISVGTNVKDLHNANKMADAFVFAFSTGNEIDKGEINGKVFANKIDGVMIFAYRLDSSNVNPIKTKPDYITQAGLDGNYSLLGLTYDKYRVFAIKDKFKDLLYNIGDDWYGAPFEDVTLTKNDTVFNGLNFKLTKEDTVEPQISKVIMTDANHLLIEMDEPIDSSKVSAKNFLIYDSTSHNKIVPGYFYKAKGGPEKYFLVIDSTLELNNDYFLIADSITDKSNNILVNQQMDFAVTDKKDTTAIKIIKIGSNYEGNLLDLDNPVITVNFNDAVPRDRLESGLTMKAQNKNIPVKIEAIDDASFNIIPGIKLKSQRTYSVDFNLNVITDVAGNKSDTTINYKFESVNKLNFTGASGKIIKPEDGLKHLVIQLISAEKNNLKYNGNIDNGKFNFSKVYPGKYLLWYFIDSDSNKIYSYGKVYPFRPSEKFGFYPDTLNLRARWPVGDLRLKLN